MTYSFSTARRGAAIVLGTALISLAACGGFTAVDIGGTITGLNNGGLVLANGDSRVSPEANATTFVFPAQVEIRSPYAVSVAAQPARQTCNVVNGTGVAGAAPVTIVSVVCNPNTYTLGGTVSGLRGANLVLTNGSDRVTVPAADASGNAAFTFPTPVADGTAYGVAILTQPAGQVCTVANGTAFMGGAPVNNVQVSCR